MLSCINVDYGCRRINSTLGQLYCGIWLVDCHSWYWLTKHIRLNAGLYGDTAGSNADFYGVFQVGVFYIYIKVYSDIDVMFWGDSSRRLAPLTQPFGLTVANLVEQQNTEYIQRYIHIRIFTLLALMSNVARCIVMMRINHHEIVLFVCRS